MSSPRPAVLPLILLGLGAGYLSGLFGVGGGIVVVPMLLALGLDQRLAAGTSVAAILPTSIVGAVGYAISGNVDWLAGLMLAIGIVAGAQLGTYLLARLPKDVLFWMFVAFLAVVIVNLWLAVPQRDAEIAIDVWAGAALVLTGLVTGILSGLLGVGGGIIVVPILMFFFGASDLVAKGTSLLMMVPGSISATIGNTRRRNVDLRAAGVVGLAACVASPLGLLTATAISPFWSNVTFSVLLTGICVQLVVKHIRSRRAR
ncbi:sulfite exporter TauE/SafE family protein [Agromyces aerolatus]|uniref:sulfite exporter TauE/SafE family protein n=1 Tax=Agromyces sp. LY-1074 TaxID=3074080 RepID=UPI002865B342|nr:MULTISPECIES: sulfite exporter TauE/SafE family protein [unclassified Agromyces]MDR5699378.1 sulfite exporter TauE/SafE family protein [Agromyces sp. LY-1074]MDR5705674.1 sulfite exporter TauE/SafE family protein [Agromyces sp. LY-1358]